MNILVLEIMIRQINFYAFSVIYILTCGSPYLLRADLSDVIHWSTIYVIMGKWNYQIDYSF